MGKLNINKLIKLISTVTISSVVYITLKLHPYTHDMSHYESHDQMHTHDCDQNNWLIISYGEYNILLTVHIKNLP